MPLRYLALLSIPSRPCKSLKFRKAVDSIPTAPTIHLPDGWTLNKKTRGQKGADKTVGPVFLCEFSAVRVTTGYVGLEVQGAPPAMWNFKLPVMRTRHLGYSSTYTQSTRHFADSRTRTRVKRKSRRR